MNDDRIVLDAVREHFHGVHAALRALVAGMPVADLDWRPGPETNSISVLVTHLLDSERFLTAFAAGIDIVRDREAAFAVSGLSAAELAAAIEEIEAVADRHVEAIAPDALDRPLTRGTRTASAAWWLLHAMGHAREHLGQAELTKQLAAARAR